MLTQRRTYLDQFLLSQIPQMEGDILDIGGKKSNKRGTFRPPLDQVNSWRYVNIDATTAPDFCCGAEQIPLPDQSIDGFLLCEVLEHLEHPEAVLEEALRLLRKDGKGWITVPFLYQVHADPHDYQRWTETKLRQVLSEIGFAEIEIQPMGGVWAVIHDLWYATLCRSPNRGNLTSKLGFRLHRYSAQLFTWLDRHFAYTSPYMTTGWAVSVLKH